MTRLRGLIAGVACAAAVGAAAQTPSDTPRFRVAVDIVSIDAVVTDRNGDVVRDLTAADFEVLQDGKKEKVTFAEFVAVTAGAAPVVAAKASSAIAVPAETPPPLPTSPISRERVQRTIVLVVDDLGLSVVGMNATRRALKGFVETGLLPTDLVAIVRTGESRGILQALTNNREALQSAIEELRYNLQSRKGVWSSGDVIQVGDSAPAADDVSELQRSGSAAASLGALNLVVQAARDLPGRKTVIFASEGFQLGAGTDATTMREEDPRVRSGLDRVIDQATRSGVVVYAIDCRGLQTGGMRAADDIHSIDIRNKPEAMGAAVRGAAADRQRTVRDAQESLAYLAEQTGGFAVLNTNDLAAGLGRIGNDIRDYYMIGYEPDRDTFALKGKPPRRHKIDVNVKRSGVRVRTRKEFIGVSDPERPPGPLTPAQQLVRAAISPFSAATIPLHATNLPGFSTGRGMFVRTVLHVDAQALAFATDAAGTRRASADLVGLVFDSDGAQVDTIATGFDVALENAAAAQAVKNGLVYTTRVRIEKPGAYQLRYAVRDRRSGAIGSAGGFVNVPDVAGGRFALSGLVLQGDQRAAGEWIDSDRFSVRPADALRVYAPGTPLSFSYEVYNAGKSVQAVASLWKGTDMLTSLPSRTLVPPPDGGRFLTTDDLALATDLPAGAYVLQIAATSDDPKDRKKGRAAVQRLSFEVR